MVLYCYSTILRYACRPRDPRTWFSLGECLLQTSRKEEAEVAYTRSAELGDPEHLSFIRLAEYSSSIYHTCITYINLCTLNARIKTC